MKYNNVNLPNIDVKGMDDKQILQAMYARKQEYLDLLKMGYHLEVCIRPSNGKVPFPNVALASRLDCLNCHACEGICYDMKAIRQYPETLNARCRNSAIFEYDRAEFFRQIREYITKNKPVFFRIHVGGDFKDVLHVAEWVAMAREFPHTIFLDYTKCYGFVNYYVKTHGNNRKKAVPENLQIMFSEWKIDNGNGTYTVIPFPNPYNFPRFGLVLRWEDMDSYKDYWTCPGDCMVCIWQHRGCIVGETTYNREH